MTEAKEHEVVRTKDSRKGTVVHVHRGGFAYEIEYPGKPPEVKTVYEEDVVEVTWRPGDCTCGSSKYGKHHKPHDHAGWTPK